MGGPGCECERLWVQLRVGRCWSSGGFLGTLPAGSLTRCLRAGFPIAVLQLGSHRGCGWAAWPARAGRGLWGGGTWL